MYELVMSLAKGIQTSLVIILAASIICAFTAEIISEVLRFRAKGLDEGIRRNITGDEELHRLLYGHPLIQALTPEVSIFTHGLEENPGLRSLIRSERKPEFIPAHTFVLALLDILLPNKLKPINLEEIHQAVNDLPNHSPSKAPLISILYTSQGDIDKFCKNVEEWFNNTMSKTSALYRAHMVRLTFSIGLILASFQNLDYVAIMTNDDSYLRAALVTEMQSSIPGSAQQQLALDKLALLKPPGGWIFSRDSKGWPCFAPADWFPKPQPGMVNPIPNYNACPPSLSYPSGMYLLKLMGWCMIAIISALGAPSAHDIWVRLTGTNQR